MTFVVTNFTLPVQRTLRQSIMIIRVRSTPCVYEESEGDIIDRPREAQ